MLSLLFLIPIALLLTVLIIGTFIWAVHNGQYDDLDRSGKEALYDEPESEDESESDLK